VRQGLLMMRFDRYQGGLYVTLLFRGFMADMSESHWFLALSVDFIIMSLATTALARGLLQHQLDINAGQNIGQIAGAERPPQPASRRRPVSRLSRRAGL
jgi:hypothetical protein